ncbi:MAG: NADH-quinone oxidoreductase subunit J [Armatimonadetes bacterium]|nr:NADH-quinone oxidoreductase subunit J [Armatimonadota bacterium]
MNLQTSIFWLLAALVLVPAFFVVHSRNLFHAGIALITCFLGIAGIYVTLGAPFVAGMQVLIYAGAIAVILLFAFMLTHDLMHPLPGTVTFQRWPGLAASLALAMVLVGSAVSTPWRTSDSAAGVAEASSIPGLGQAFLTNYLIPFELIALLLLVALVGAVVIARKEEAAPELYE